MAKLKIPSLKQIAYRFSDKYIEDKVSERMQMEMTKVTAQEIIKLRPKYLPLGSGSIEKPHPLGVTFSTLREFADYYPIARACIEYRKSQITQLAWRVVPQEMNEAVIEDKVDESRVKQIKQLFKYPTGKKDVTFTDWIKQILEDLLVIDAVAIYRRRNRRGDIIGYLPIDGATIHLALETDGTTPEPPGIAYIQKIQGQEKAKLTMDELIYLKMGPKTYDPFGRSPLETLIITVTTALKLQAYNLAYLSEGDVPSGFIKVPRDIASSRDQLKEWQDAWDAMLAGDPRFQQKLKFLPEGMEYEPAIKQSDMTFERFEKWLLTNTCSVYGVQPNALGFNFETNRSTAETSYEVGKERGLFPTALFVKEMMDRMIQDDLHFDNLEFRWTNLNPTNKIEEANVATKLVNSGLIAIDEWRIGESLRPIGAKDPFIMTPVGPIFVKDLAAQSESGQMPILPYKPPSGNSKQEQKPSGETENIPNVPAQAKMKIQTVNDSNLRIEELRRWRRMATNDWRQGKPIRIFKTDILDSRTQSIIQNNLSQIQNREDIEKVFTPFLTEDSSVVSPLLDLYAEIGNTLEAGNYRAVATPATFPA